MSNRERQIIATDEPITTKYTHSACVFTAANAVKATKSFRRSFYCSIEKEREPERVRTRSQTVFMLRKFNCFSASNAKNNGRVFYQPSNVSLHVSLLHWSCHLRALFSCSIGSSVALSEALRTHTHAVFVNLTLFHSNGARF